MSSQVSLEEFAPQCPSGGEWYTCGPQTKTKFVGCCETDSDPCEVMCTDGNLKPGAFDPKYHGRFVDASCGAGVDFFTCVIAPQNTTFWGCCQSSPCQPGGCPATDLEPAILNRDDQFEAFNATGSGVDPSSTAGTPSTSSPFPSADGGEEKGSKTPIAAIAGGAAGGAIVIALLVALVIFLLRRSKKAKESRGDYVVAGSQNAEGSNTATGVGEAGKHQSYQSQTAFPPYSPPPVYSSPVPGSEYHGGKQSYRNIHEQQHEPQELPAEFISQSPILHDAEVVTAGHSRGPSELSGQVVSGIAELNSAPSPTEAIAELNSAPSPTETTAQGLGLRGVGEVAGKT